MKFLAFAGTLSLALASAGCMKDGNGNRDPADSLKEGAASPTAASSLPACEIGSAFVARSATIIGALSPVPAKTTANVVNGANKVGAGCGAEAVVLQETGK